MRCKSWTTAYRRALKPGFTIPPKTIRVMCRRNSHKIGDHRGKIGIYIIRWRKPVKSNPRPSSQGGEGGEGK